MMAEFAVTISSVPGMFAQYSGDVKVWALDADDAVEMAFRKLKGTFPDRNRAMWRVDDVKQTHATAG